MGKIAVQLQLGLGHPVLTHYHLIQKKIKLHPHHSVPIYVKYIDNIVT
jgi:hypothetical protein